MARSVLPFLMFQGRAEEAMQHYLTVFPAARIDDIQRYGVEGPGKEGSVYQAWFTIAGQRVMCIDSPSPHPFSFTPAFSLYVECEDAVELERVFKALAEGGQVFMPLGDYGFSTRFGWVSDRFGVSWQLNLA